MSGSSMMYESYAGILKLKSSDRSVGGFDNQPYSEKRNTRGLIKTPGE